jgi:hypothetical protein
VIKEVLMPITIGSSSVAGKPAFSGNAGSTPLQRAGRLASDAETVEHPEGADGFKPSLRNIVLSMVFSMAFNLVLSNIVLRYVLKNREGNRIDEDSVTLSMTEEEDSIAEDKISLSSSEEEQGTRGNPEALEVTFRRH